ncbi:CRISPR-associated endonuclease Cas1 [Desulfonema magnum]|uniref:CRISPR-associated endonuclease Cas1 n=1 Tax=Desulfonema magnum TaxID=45655 RepID=A0A975GRX0_9BACT|nr:CRISPR-associated endonuclease Cas1 [Desulfonema magnum]QTA90418.1 CRISPR-associated endonuclease Cas1 [Desulfonema magnum]
MSELTVILDQKDMVVTLDSDTVRVDRPGCQLQRIPINMISRLIVKGNPMVSCGVWRALAEKNIPVTLLPLRGKGSAAYVGSGLSMSVEKRTAQHKAIHEEKTVLAISRWLLSLKLKGQESVLEKLSDNSDVSEPVRKYRADIQKADNRNSLMGYEGSAASHYFKMISTLIPGEWKFKGRNRRPPKDPVNALLSLSYTIAGGEVSRAIQDTGLDPAAGFLHISQNGRESLMLDVLEPLRPKTDWFVFQLLGKNVSPKDFTTGKKDGCFLNKKGRKAYYAAWSAWQEADENDNSLKKFAKEIINEMVRYF